MTKTREYRRTLFRLGYLSNSYKGVLIRAMHERGVYQHLIMKLLGVSRGMVRNNTPTKGPLKGRPPGVPQDVDPAYVEKAHLIFNVAGPVPMMNLAPVIGVHPNDLINEVVRTQEMGWNVDYCKVCGEVTLFKKITNKVCDSCLRDGHE